MDAPMLWRSNAGVKQSTLTFTIMSVTESKNVISVNRDCDRNYSAEVSYVIFSKIVTDLRSELPM